MRVASAVSAVSGISAVSALTVLTVLTQSVPSVRADTLINNTGIVAPGTTVTFSEVPLGSEAPVTNQYAAFGVTFSPSLFYNSQPTFFPTPSLSNYTFDSAPVQVINNPASIFFTQNVSAAAVAVQTNPGTTTFTALLNGSVVQTFGAPTTFSTLPNTSQASNYYGFTNLVFNELRIQSSTLYFQLDNLQFTPAAVPNPVPEPSEWLAMGMAATSVMGLMVRARRRRNTRAAA